jgi:Fatty acid desaturase
MLRIAEHTGMEEGPDPLTNTRTTLTNPLIRFLYWNMPYHAAHHLAPSGAVPRAGAVPPAPAGAPSGARLRAGAHVIDQGRSGWKADTEDRGRPSLMNDSS